MKLNTKGESMFASFTNAFTGYKVHVKTDQVATVTRISETETMIELTGGGRVTVKESTEAVMEMVEPKKAKREMETR